MIEQETILQNYTGHNRAGHHTVYGVRDALAHKKRMGQYNMAHSRNPCRYCIAANEYKGRHSPSYGIQCQECQYRKEHEKYLESKRQFKAGDPITSFPELLKQEWVIWHGHTKHIEMFRSMSLRTVEMFLKHGAFKKAIRKENSDG